MNAEARRRLRPVIDIARQVLDDYEDDEVPARMRRIARSSARTLPPPFERSLIDELVSDDALRADVASAWTDSGRSDELIETFLDDPGAALASLESVESEAELLRVTGELDVERTRVEELDRELGRAKHRLTQERREAAKERKALRDGAKRSREGIEAALRESRAEATDLRAALSEAEQSIAEREALIADLQSKEDRAVRRAARRDAGAPAMPRPAPIPTGDPAAIAAWLDTAERVLRPYRDAAGAPPDRGPDGPFALPAGVAPDRAAGVAALAGLRPDLVILDGYNVAGALGLVALSGAEGRNAVLNVANVLSRLVAGELVVVFDAVGVEGRGSYTTELGVQVRFAGDRSADDAIVALLGERPGRTAVVTNDRELRERATLLGALVLWSDGLVEWANG